ncbi:hypothetical protein VIGAN_UM009100, partial [Vigna angularis var. angularis]
RSIHIEEGDALSSTAHTWKQHINGLTIFVQQHTACTIQVITRRNTWIHGPASTQTADPVTTRFPADSDPTPSSIQQHTTLMKRHLRP